MGTTRLIYIGGYTPDSGGSGPGVTTVRRESDGRLGELAVTAASGPSFLAAHPALPVLYAVGETAEGTVSAFTRHPDGRLTRLGEHSSGGNSPCHVAVDPYGSWLAIANYGDGVLGVRRLDEFGRMAGPPKVFPHTGSGPDPDRQAGPHAHQAVFGPDGGLYVTDLGTDEIRRYLVGDGVRPHPDGPIRVTPGTGPRHLFHSAGRWYLAGELNGAVTMYDAAWNELATVPASRSPEPNAPSHLEVSADGRFVYVANRGPDTVTVLDSRDLSHVAEVPCGGAWPRHFAVVGDRMYVADQHSAEITALTVKSGVPQAVAERFAVETPSCVLPVPAL
ncbi:lactonase family protein [Spongiactinospora sp. TRM90649]|uniref:lactonase family protein n=1 Tax=Spongiactinospora sp. TRM90649 TaxID=3031114 RepID=UPI0023F7EA8A|nr:lactonase family protein [Spongiactinospora sp. TRM90649]MDF5756754.1 lactonase family protein [Spongiactinospora sp. TRM90649]